MVEVKIYRVEGEMLLSHDRMPEWRRFSIEVRAIRPEHAIEKVLSELGSRHKLRRKHIRIRKVEEISLEEAKSRHIAQLAQLHGWRY